MHITTHHRFLYASIVSVLIPSLLIGSYDIIRSAAAFSFTRFERLEITYVAADQSSRKIYCKLKNTGSMSLTLIEVLVNGSVVTTGDLLPVPISLGYGYTYSFRYDGPWEGLIEITFTSAGKKYTTRVDVLEASKNSIAQAFMDSVSGAELWNVFIDSLQLHGSANFENPSAMNMISRARTRLTEAQDAYNRGDYESAYALATSALFLIDQAILVEKSYKAEKTGMLLAAGAGLGVVAVVISLSLLRKRIRKTHGPLLHVISNPRLDRNRGSIGAILLADSSVISIPIPVIGFLIGSIGEPQTLGFILGFSFISFLASILGETFLLLALRGYSEYYKDERIFRNALYGFIFTIYLAFLDIGLFQVFQVPWFFYEGAWTAWCMDIMALALAFIPLLLGRIFYMKSLNLLSTKSGEGGFEVVGWLLPASTLVFIAWLFPPITTMTFAFNGAVLVYEGILLIAWVYLVKAFHSLKVPSSSTCTESSSVLAEAH